MWLQCTITMMIIIRISRIVGPEKSCFFLFFFCYRSPTSPNAYSAHHRRPYRVSVRFRVK